MPDPVDTDDRLYDEYLDAALRGAVEDPDVFCERHGRTGSELRDWIGGVHDLLEAGVASAAAPQAEAEAVPFDRLGDYRIVRRLGEGGMGVVYLAEQIRLRRTAAVKVLRPEFADSPTAIARLAREARAIAKLRHPNIVKVFEFGEHEGVHFLAMELVPGESLDVILARSRESGTRVPVRDMLAWLVQIAEALACAHEHGVLHRDVKPSNIRVTPKGDATLLDFGLARDLLGGDPTLTKAFAGSPAYCSPEQLSGVRDRIGAASDQYSLGVTAYEGLTGATPHDAESIEQLITQIMTGVVCPLRQRDASIARDLEVVVMKSLERVPARRYADTAAFGADLRAVLEFRPIRARAPGPLTRVSNWVRRHRALSTLIAAMLLALVSIATTSAWNRAAARTQAANKAQNLIARAHERIDRLVESRVAAGRSANLLDDLERAVRTRWFRDEENADLLLRRIELERYFGELEAATAEVIELMARARRFDPDASGIDDVWARFYYERWVGQMHSKDSRGVMSLYRSMVDKFDESGRWSDHLRGTTSLSVATDPPGAQVFLLRYARVADVYPDSPERRLVPGPSAGSAPRLCGQLVVRVVRDSGGLRADDLIFAVDGTRVADLEDLRAAMHGGARVSVLRGTSERACELPAEFEWRATAAPLDLRESVALGATPILARPIEAGDFVAVLRLDGYETVRVPFHIYYRNDEEAPVSQIRVTLVPRGTTPLGFVRVVEPAGGRDFWILDREVSCDDYLEFLNAPSTLQEIEDAVTLVRVPRQVQTLETGGDWPRGADGRYRLPPRLDPRAPVLGVSWGDARAFSLWMRRTRGDLVVGERKYKYGFPTPAEWRAAGSGYGMGYARRRYPFGDHWHAPLAKSRFASLRVGPEASLSYAMDESPYGVFDMAGSAAEWCELFIDADERQRGLAGGSWLESEPSAFLLTRFRPADSEAVSREFGFRLVLRRRRDRR